MKATDETLRAEFVRYYKHKKGRKDITIEGYLTEIDRLEEYGGRPLIEYKTIQSLDDLIIRVKENHPGKNAELLSDVTTAKIATCAKVWLDFCVMYGHTQAPHPYWWGTGFEKGKSPEADFFDRDDGQDLDVINKVLFHPRLMRRDEAIIWLFFATGIRRKELTGLNISDIDTFERWIHVRKTVGKGEKWRYVPFDPLCAQVMEDYVFGLIASGHHPSEPLFQNKEGGRLQPGTIWKMLDRLAEFLFGEGTEIKINPHKWRHSLASFLAQRMNSFALAKLMGHETPQTTAIYYHRKPKSLQNDYNNAVGLPVFVQAG